MDELVEDGTIAMIRGPDGVVHLREGTCARPVRSGVLAQALTPLVGEADAVTEADLAALTAGAPVEVLEGPEGGPYIVVAGERIAVRGLPLPHGVRESLAPRRPGDPVIEVAPVRSARSSP